MSLATGWPPELALGAALAGVLLVYVEVNRPGRVLPGTAGLLLLLLGVNGLLCWPHREGALVAVLAGLGVLALRLGVRRAGGLLTGLGTGLLMAGLAAWPAAGGSRVWVTAAGLSGLLVGVTTGWLAGIGSLARRSKRSHAGATAGAVASGVREQWE